MNQNLLNWAGGVGAPVPVPNLDLPEGLDPKIVQHNLGIVSKNTLNKCKICCGAQFQGSLSLVGTKLKNLLSFHGDFAIELEEKS